MYPFITLRVNYTFIQLTAKIYPSTFLLLYMSTDVPVHHYTCSVYLFLWGITSTITFQLIYWCTYTQIYPKIKLPVYLHASLCLTTKTYLSSQLLVYMPIDLPVHYPTCSFWLFHSDKPFVLTCPLTCSSKYSQIYPFFFFFYQSTGSIPCVCVCFTWLYMHTYLSTHLLVCVPTDPPENECTC